MSRRPPAPPDWVSRNASPSGGLTAYTTVTGELPVVTYVAAKAVVPPDFMVLVN